MHLGFDKNTRDMEPQQKKAYNKKMNEGMTLGMSTSLMLATVYFDDVEVHSFVISTIDTMTVATVRNNGT